MDEDTGRVPSGPGCEPTASTACGVLAESHPSRIIFLDIDGPMIPATMYLVNRMCSFERKFPATTVAVLNELCRMSKAKIVFNTTHNNSFRDVADIEDALVEQGLNADHLHPSDLKTRYPSIPRAAAVKDWLARHPEVTHWVALDDAICADEPNMILVDPDAGLHIGHLNRACEVLGGGSCLILM